LIVVAALLNYNPAKCLCSRESSSRYNQEVPRKFAKI
jgi:hypothetical protein